MGGGTDIAIDSVDIIVVNNPLSAVVEARAISRTGNRRMLPNVSLAVLFNGIGLLYPV